MHTDTLGIAFRPIFITTMMYTVSLSFLADRTDQKAKGRACGTALRLSICRRSFVTLCIAAKRCVLEQKSLLTFDSL